MDGGGTEKLDIGNMGKENIHEIYGGKQTESGWERSNNRELQEQLNQPDIMGVVKG